MLESCKVHQSQQQSDGTNVTATENDLKEFICETNVSGSHKLCISPKVGKAKNEKVISDITTVMIIDSMTGDVILSEKIKGGYAKWIDDRNVEIYYPAGIPDDYKLLRFNVDEREKSEINRQ